MTIRFFTLCCFLLATYCLPAQTISTLLTQAGAQFEGITWLPDGRIYVVDFATGEVFRINTAGDITKITTANGALGGAADQAGNYYFSEFVTGNIYKIDAAENVSIYSSGLVGPAGILIDDANQLMYVANYNGNSISKIDMRAENPSPVILASGGCINGPDGLVFAPNGDLISCNFNDNNIQRITTEGTVSPFATIADSPNSGYIVRLGDQYIVTGAYGPNIYSISLDGMVAVFAGTGQAGATNGNASDAQFTFPNGIALSPSGDTLLITESTTAGQIRMITGLEATTNVEVFNIVQGLQISPNPSSEQVNIRLRLENNSDLQINLVDLQSTIVDTFFTAARFRGDLDQTFSLPTQLMAGVYFIQIRAGKELLHYTLLVE